MYPRWRWPLHKKVAKVKAKTLCAAMLVGAQGNGARLVIRVELQAAQDVLLCDLMATAVHKAAGGLAGTLGCSFRQMPYSTYKDKATNGR